MGDTTKNLGDTSINRSKHWELLQIVVYNVLLLQTSGQSTWKLCNLTGFTQLETNYKIASKWPGSTAVGSSTGAANEASKNSVSAGLRFQKTAEDLQEAVMMRGDLGLVHVWSIGAWIEFKDSPTQKLYRFGCYGVSNLIQFWSVQRYPFHLSVQTCSQRHIWQMRPRCVGQQLRSGWHHILTIYSPY